MQKIMLYIALYSYLPFLIDTNLLLMDICAASASGRSTAIAQIPMSHARLFADDAHCVNEFPLFPCINYDASL
jgi:hypothetical protein